MSDRESLNGEIFQALAPSQDSQALKQEHQEARKQSLQTVSEDLQAEIRKQTNCLKNRLELRIFCLERRQDTIIANPVQNDVLEEFRAQQ